MRATSIMLLVICICFGNALLNIMGVFDTYNVDSSTNIVQEINSSVNDYSYSGSVSSSLGALGDFITGLWTFIKLFSISLVLPRTILTGFGVPSNIAFYFTFPIYILYMVAIIQMVSGRYIEW